MKKEIQRGNDRGESNLGWLHSRFSFSFADYHDPKKMGFGKLRVLNDDVIKPGKGFGLHDHRNMEIITIVTEGKLEHKDSTGVIDVLKPGDIQVMSAGFGISHSEYNHSKTDTLKLFQIWIETKEHNVAPRHAKKTFKLEHNKLNLIVSGTGTGDALHLHQDAKMYLGTYDSGTTFDHAMHKEKGVFVFVIEGTIIVEDEELHARDSIALSDAPLVHIAIKDMARLLIIEVPL
jgi:hypothetical protein